MNNLEEQLRRAPFVRLIAALSMGIFWQSSPLKIAFNAFPLAIALFIAYLIFLTPYFSKNRQRGWISGCAALLFIFFSGITLVQQQKTKSDLPLQQRLSFITEINDNPTQTGRFIKIQAIVKAYVDSNHVQYSTHEKIFLYIEPDTSFVMPEVGSLLAFQSTLSAIPPPQNPAEFDYKNYLAQRKIFASAFVQSSSCQVNTKISIWKKLQYFPLKMQQKALEIFEKSRISDDEYAVLAALTLGNKQLLNDELRTAYASAGVMHLLAVSGLHVGIIMMVLNFTFSFFGNRRKGAIIKKLLIIICLWIYAAVVGFSPSVTRATVMFSFVLIGQITSRRISIYNSLAASAFCLCVFNPLILFDIGFQLSYCAVLSIVYFQPKIYHLLYIRNKFLENIWSLATVSFAAQIGTMPISLYYFHQFPNYFLLTNITVISLTGFIVYAAAGYLVINVIPLLSDIVAFLLDVMLKILNGIVRFVEMLPHSVTVGIYLNAWQALLLTAMILSIAFYLSQKRRIYLWAAVYSLLAIIGLRNFHSVDVRQQEIFAVYQIKNTSFIHFINGNKNLALLDQERPSNYYNYNLGNYFTEKGIRMKEYLLLNDLPSKKEISGNIIMYRGFIIFRQQLIKVLQDERISRETPSIETDYLVVTGDAKMYPSSALKRYRARQIILDASVPFYRAKQWIAAAETENIPIHNVKEQGAWIKQIH